LPTRSKPKCGKPGDNRCGVRGADGILAIHVPAYRPRNSIETTFMRVPLFLRDHQVAFQTLIHAPAYSAQRRAKYLGIPGRQVAKCVLLSCPTGFVVAVLPAICRVDLAAVARTHGEPVRLANADEIADFFRDCQWGALTPFGRLYGLSTIMDDSVDPDGTIVFPAQHH